MTSPQCDRLVIGPNASLSPGWAWTVFCWVALVAFGICGISLLCGFWPILPWMGLEIGAFGAALAVAMHRNRYREVLTIEPETLRLEVGMTGRGALTVICLPRRAARVMIEAGPHRNSPTRLLLVQAAQQVELGRCLTDAERERLALRIRQLIHPGWTPPLPRPEPVDGQWPFIKP